MLLDDDRAEGFATFPSGCKVYVCSKNEEAGVECGGPIITSYGIVKRAIVNRTGRKSIDCRYEVLIKGGVDSNEVDREEIIVEERLRFQNGSDVYLKCGVDGSSSTDSSNGNVDEDDNPSTKPEYKKARILGFFDRPVISKDKCDDENAVYYVLQTHDDDRIYDRVQESDIRVNCPQGTKNRHGDNEQPLIPTQHDLIHRSDDSDSENQSVIMETPIMEAPVIESPNNVSDDSRNSNDCNSRVKSDSLDYKERNVNRVSIDHGDERINTKSSNLPSPPLYKPPANDCSKEQSRQDEDKKSACRKILIEPLNESVESSRTVSTSTIDKQCNQQNERDNKYTSKREERSLNGTNSSQEEHKKKEHRKGSDNHKQNEFDYRYTLALSLSQNEMEGKSTTTQVRLFIVIAMKTKFYFLLDFFQSRTSKNHISVKKFSCVCGPPKFDSSTNNVMLKLRASDRRKVCEAGSYIIKKLKENAKNGGKRFQGLKVESDSVVKTKIAGINRGQDRKYVNERATASKRSFYEMKNSRNRDYRDVKHKDNNHHSPNGRMISPNGRMMERNVPFPNNHRREFYQNSYSENYRHKRRRTPSESIIRIPLQYHYIRSKSGVKCICFLPLIVLNTKFFTLF